MLKRFNLFVLMLILASLPFAVSCRKPSENEGEKPAGTPGETSSAYENAAPAPSEHEAPADSAEDIDDSVPEADSEEPTDPDKAEISPSKDDPSLDTILSRYYDAIGGPGKWADVNTMKYTGKMHSMGKLFTTAIVYKRPDKCRIDFSLGHIYFIQSFDGSEAWKYNPTDGSKPTVLEGDDASDLIETCDFDGPLIDHKAKGHKIQYLGRETAEGKEAYKLKITNKTGSVDYYYLDTESYLPLLVKGKAMLKDKEVDSATTVGDYIDTGGIIIPYYFEFDLDGLDDNEIFKVSTVEINPELDDTIFTFPRRIEDSY